jgi:hypothetical protein
MYVTCREKGIQEHRTIEREGRTGTLYMYVLYYEGEREYSCAILRRGGSTGILLVT